MNHPATCVLVLIGFVLAANARAQTSFRMTTLYSDPSGDYQYIQLVESWGLDGQHKLEGLTLTVTSRAGVVKRFTIPSDLPSTQTSHRFVLIGTSPGSDYTIPQRFIPTDGGTIEFADIDTWTYDSLFADGFSALSRRYGQVATTQYTNAQYPYRGFRLFSGEWWLPISREQAVTEYYKRTLAHYFVAVAQPDIDALDSGRTPGWERTGHSFWAWINHYFDPRSDDPGVSAERQPDNLQPVCRLYMPPSDGDSHFFSAWSSECSEALQRHPSYILETEQAFLATLPDATGQCAQGAQPVYRLWNGRVDSNHRYTTSTAVRDEMVARGYIAEGVGPAAVMMCVGGAR